MRYVELDGKQASVLGFGCGAVMGRVGRADSLRAMEAAWDAGITFFDTARSYGYGEAESVLGDFLRGRREKAVIATKFGIWPQRQGLAKKIAKPIVRALLQAVPSARAAVRRGAAGEIQGGQFTVEVLRASIDESLRRLRTEYVDMLFLHEATLSAMRDDALMEELAKLVQAGKVRRAGISADCALIGEAIQSGPPVLRAMQFAANVFDMGVTEYTRANERDLFFVANHPFGGVQRAQQTQQLLASLAEDGSMPHELREKLSSGGRAVTAEVIFGSILRGTGIHTIAASMLHVENLRANAAAMDSRRFTDEEIALLRAKLMAS